MTRLVQNSRSLKHTMQAEQDAAFRGGENWSLIHWKKVELEGCAIVFDRYYDPPCLKQTERFERRRDSGKQLGKLFLKKAVDFINEFDRLSAASTEKPPGKGVRKLKHFCSLKTEWLIKSIASNQKWCGLLKPIAFKLLKAFRFASANRVLKFERNRINPFLY